MPEFDVPVDGMVEVRVDGDRVTRFGADAGETIEITMEPITESENDA